MAAKGEIDGQMKLSQESGESFYSPQTAKELLKGFEALLRDETTAPLIKEEQDKTVLSNWRKTVGRDGREERVKTTPSEVLHAAIEKSMRNTDTSGLSDDRIHEIVSDACYAITEDKQAELREARDREARRLVGYAKIRDDAGSEELRREYTARYLTDLDRQEGFHDSWQLFRKILEDETYDDKKREKINQFVDDTVAAGDIDKMSWLIELADTTFSKRYYWFDKQIEEYTGAASRIINAEDL